MSRIENFLAQTEKSQLVDLPEIDYAEYLFSYADEIGFYKSNGFGVEPITWIDIHAWSVTTNTPLTAWEATTIMTLSKTFASSYHAFNEKQVPSPYMPEIIDRKAVSKQAGSVFRSIAMRNKVNVKGP